jgi:hypothetical protein
LLEPDEWKPFKSGSEGSGNAPPLPDWRIWFYLLESAGLEVQLVRAADVKHAPGRPKSDKLDAVWLAKLTERGVADIAIWRSCGSAP